jgi:hypothetical protein
MVVSIPAVLRVFIPAPARLGLRNVWLGSVSMTLRTAARTASPDSALSECETEPECNHKRSRMTSDGSSLPDGHPQFEAGVIATVALSFAT